MSHSARNILILGGTKEAAETASKLLKEGHTVTTSLAGRTKEPRPVSGAVRIGGFGGAKGLAAFLTAEKFDQVIDATHPFAEQISANAVEAARLTDVPLLIQQRPMWQRRHGDDWLEVETIEQAVAAIPKDARILLALGRQHISPFATRSDAHFVIRMIDPPERPLSFPHHTLVLGKPSANADVEARMLKEHTITHIVCRNSGGAGAYAKIEAARSLGLPVIMIQRPKP